MLNCLGRPLLVADAGLQPRPEAGLARSKRAYTNYGNYVGLGLTPKQWRELLARKQSRTASMSAGPPTQPQSSKDVRLLVLRHQRGGKNPLRTLYTLDGMHGTLDPMFDDHCLLVKHLALAWWEQWVDAADLEQAYHDVVSKAAAGTLSWGNAAGPTAALWLSLQRIGRRWTSPKVCETTSGALGT